MIKFEPTQNAFASGGNRLCFVDPANPKRCIKILRTDRTPAIKKREKGIIGKLKPIEWFDDNLEEYKVYLKIDKYIGEAAYKLIPRCYGFSITNYGEGLSSELIRDSDGLVSISLKQYVWQNGFTNELKSQILIFQNNWIRLGMPSRNLLLHNIVVEQQDSSIKRLVVIDGLGWPDIFPIGYWIKFFGKIKASRKITRLPQAIKLLLEKKQKGLEWGYHGWLSEVDRSQSFTEK